MDWNTFLFEVIKFIIAFIIACPFAWLVIKISDHIIDKEIEEELMCNAFRKKRLGELLTWDDIRNLCQMTIKDIEYKDKKL